MSKLNTPEHVIDALEKLYSEAVSALSSALDIFLHSGTPPSPNLRESGAFCYPQIRLVYNPDGPPPPISRAFGKMSEAGTYVSTITRPDFFRDYLTEQLALLMRDYDIDVYVEQSDSEIPYAYVWEQGQASGLEEISPAELARHFPSPNLADIGDEVADGELYEPYETHPLALFDAQRVDFSLKRLQHYCGTPVEHFQHYVLFTNLEVSEPTDTTRAEIDASPWRRFQMPAYHLRAPNGGGITLVNIGVGPSNAKTITDHLAVLRPEVWLMVGHCGGLRHSQAIGDYVLAHAYLREDHVLDSVLPPEIPVPPIAEVQVALQEAAATVTGENEKQLKRRLRTGTVVTTDDRNWELRFSATARRFNKSRAIAIDMESATIAANGFRLRVPYGVLLCVSDKPLHGEIKLPGAANRFYERAIGEHIRIGIETLERLSADKGAKLHSRKLRAFDEPPFR